VRHLEADLIVANGDTLLLLSGDGEVLEPDEDAIAIGAGGTYAYAAARALLDHTELDARAIVEAAMRITARICIFTNDNLMIETVGGEDGEKSEESGEKSDEASEASDETKS
jgi:ATP-dependent HslUV protease subunit HslV